MKWNSIRLAGYSHGIVTEAVHKTFSLVVLSRGGRGSRGLGVLGVYEV